jgi:DNA-binding CsgD family transcriptional regulator
LTIREFEVARKIAEGLTNAQIAGELFVSPKTVSAHVEHILAKLGAGRRAEIAAWVSSVPAASVAVSDGQRVA